MTVHPTWALRVASRPEAGGGHVRRSLALARELAGAEKVLFVLDEGEQGWVERLRDFGFEAVRDGGEDDRLWSGCILDGYDYSLDDAIRWKSRTGFLAVIDDFGDPVSMADLAICSATDPATSVINGVPALTGFGFALFEPPPAGFSRQPGNSAARVLVSFGLRDSLNGTGLVLEALARVKAQGFPVEVMIATGGKAPHLEAIRDAAQNIGAKLIVDAPSLYGLLAATDLMIGAGGVTLLERMACGVPSVTLSTAGNQDLLVAMAANSGGTLAMGPIGEAAADKLANQIGHLLEDDQARAVMSSRAKNLVDGRGPGRVAQAIFNHRQRIDDRAPAQA